MSDLLYLNLARTLAEQIDQGHFRPGDRMPSVRALARRHQCSIASIVAALRRLEDDGRIEARPRSGFFVRARPLAPALAAPAPAAPRPSPVTGQELVLRLVQAANDPAIIQLGAAVPDASFIPTQAVAAALARAARDQRVKANSYEFPPGLPALRRQLARRMAEASVTLHPDEIVVTDGCQEGLTLALRAVTVPGDVVAVESPTFYGLLQVIDALGLKALEIPAHPRDGLSPEALELALDRWPVRACVVVPNFSNPLGYCLSDERKARLVALLGSRGIPLIEDDVYGDLGFGPRRPPACRAFAEGGDVLYCASLSKTLSPGLRIGWVAAGRHRERVEYLKYVTNLAAPTAPQIAAAELLESGRYERHLRRVRGDYARAVARMSDAVTRCFPEGTRVSRPEGGFVIWIELPAGLPAAGREGFALAHRALAAGISIAPGPIFSATGKYRNCLRLSCACKWDARVERAVATLGELVRA